MEMIADILLVAGALGAAFYCFVLGRRLNRFNDLEKGMGGAVAVLSAQVDDLSKTLAAAQASATQSATSLTELSSRAEQTAQRLELQIAAFHDLPPAPAPLATTAPATAAAPDPVEPSAPETPQPPPVVDEGQPMFVRRVAGGAPS